MNCGRSLELMSEGKILADPDHHAPLRARSDPRRVPHVCRADRQRPQGRHPRLARAGRYLFGPSPVPSYYPIGPPLGGGHDDLQCRWLRAAEPACAGLCVLSRRRLWVQPAASWSAGCISCSSGSSPGSIFPRSSTWASPIGRSSSRAGSSNRPRSCATRSAIYVNPQSWVNRHRHHHAFSDRDGDPNKLGVDGFWKTLYLCLFPYPCQFDMARDPIFETWPMRLASSPFFAVVAQITSYGFLWLLVSDWAYALALWVSVRLIALWTNMVQNYWTHDRRFGARRYQDDDNAMNIGEWLPVTATFSACLQNNHHHYPQFFRLSHSPGRVRLRLPGGAPDETPGPGEALEHRGAAARGSRARGSWALRFPVRFWPCSPRFC